jgi:hypothetical protein
VLGVLVGLLWGSSLVLLGRTTYAWGRSDVQAANHRVTCIDLSAMIAGMSAFWRKLGYPQAADKLGVSYNKTCQ